MASIIDNLRTVWGSVEELDSLVPASRVVIGPLNEGQALPVVGITGLTARKKLRSSGQDIHTVVVTVVTEARDIVFLTMLGRLMEKNLQHLDGDDYQTMSMQIDWDIAAGEVIPPATQIWTATYRLEYDAVCKVG